MTNDEIKAKVASDVQELTEHKDSIASLLMDPSVETFEGVDAKPRPLWVVGKRDEFMITFNEFNSLYGLAFRNIIGDLIHLGDDGSLADVYENLISREEDDGDTPKKSFVKNHGSVPSRPHGSHRPDFKKKQR